MADTPAPDWWLRCPWCSCSFHIAVGARGSHGSDPGAGVEAADLMKRHIVAHDQTWQTFLEVTEKQNDD